MINVRLLRSVVALMAFVAALLIPGSAFAYNEGGSVPSSVTACTACHSTTAGSPTTGTVDVTRGGPHGGYTTTSSKCAVCHSVHQAAANKLLPAATASAACATCHDGTGGNGVYGVIAARGLTVAARHRIDVTNVVPGGDGTTGGSATQTFGGPGGTMSCDDCHSPHGSNVVTPFTTDRLRTASYESTWNAGVRSYTSSALLKQQPGSYKGAPITEYGSNWCGSCHLGRIAHNMGSAFNHPVESTATAATPYVYRNVPQLSADTSTGVTVLGAMGRTNRGYLMLLPRAAAQAGHPPICQQCHGDPRNVGSLAPDGATAKAAPFTVTTPTGATAGDNPRFQVFPHESTATAFMVESNDDLCTNCHTTMSLP